MLTAAKSIYLLTMVLLKIFVSKQDELSFAGIHIILISPARFCGTGDTFYQTRLTPSPDELQFPAISRAIRRLLCFDRTESKDRLKQSQFTPVFGIVPWRYTDE